ncbi:hypothetical protein [Propionivibrio dicarboxylicus]|uniref:Holin of 3TMs, for gene-transfer release n=1 Tax=Propionivibrio dicarboxylicus TaxID=83767 RepID=A0A1G8AQN0_9RHOO|nr:hypothetical protein [Propionivibrio dicarboxylicus]SDH22590.1 hypothetical protein SAMN05660652_01448 [Propionivibrio dicarboxylicus]
MFTALLSFLGGNAFRLIFGEVAAFFSKKQEAALEIERLKLQGELDAAQHARNLEAIKVQADLGVKVIEARMDAALVEAETSAWAQAVADVGKQTGIRFLDVWNGSIRPALASMAMAIVVFQFFNSGFTLDEWTRELVGAILGIYVADRHLSKRGK